MKRLLLAGIALALAGAGVGYGQGPTVVKLVGPIELQMRATTSGTADVALVSFWADKAGSATDAVARAAMVTNNGVTITIDGVPYSVTNGANIPIVGASALQTNGNAFNLTNFPPIVVQTNATELGNWQIANTGELSGAWSVLRPLRTGGAILDPAGGYVGLFTPTTRNVYNTGTVIVASHSDVLRAYDAAGNNGVAVQESITNHAQRIGAIEGAGYLLPASTQNLATVAQVVAVTNAIDAAFIASKGGLTNANAMAIATVTATNQAFAVSETAVAWNWRPTDTNVTLYPTFSGPAAGWTGAAVVDLVQTNCSIAWPTGQAFYSSGGRTTNAPAIMTHTRFLLDWWDGTMCVGVMSTNGAATP